MGSEGRTTMLLALLGAVTVIAGDARMQTSVDPITDKVQTLAGVRQGAGHFAIVCDAPDQLTVNIAGSEYLGSERAGLLAGGAEVTYRFDRAEPYSARAELNGKTLILAPGENILFMLRMRGATKLYLRVLKYDDNTADFDVTLSGFGPFIDPVLASCGYGPNGRRLKKRKL